MPKNFVGFYEHFNENDLVVNILNSPAFEGNGRFLFPWDDTNRYTPDMTLADVAELMLWHTNMNPKEMVDGINVLVDEVNAGQDVFYDIYSEEEKEEDPTKVHTKLIFMRGKPGAPFVLIVPGGGGYYVATMHAGLPVAKKFIEHGYNAFVLDYRVGEGIPGETNAVEDICRAISFIRNHAEKLEVDPDEYALEGESAGASFVFASVYGSSNNPRSSSLLRPIAVIEEYPLQEDKHDFESFDPPLYVISGKQDHLSSWVDIEARCKKMEEAGIQVSMRFTEEEAHGFGTGKGTQAQGWVDDAITFWEGHLLNPVQG